LACVAAGVSIAAQQPAYAPLRGDFRLRPDYGGQAGGQASRDDEPLPIKRGVAPPPGPYAPGFDALHYDIALELPATGTLIRAVTTIRVAIRAPRASALPLDLTGLAVDRVRVGGAPAPFTYEAGRLRVSIPSRASVGDTVDVEVAYHGHPDDGLIIQQNIHGDRTAFADNWPDRARFWFPSIDHPSDKATVAFTVSAPAEWTVVANGVLVDSGDTQALVALLPPEIAATGNDAGTSRRVWRWRTDRPIPTYTMVIAAAKFATAPPVRSCSEGRCVDVTWWAFPADAAAMERSVARADAMLRYFAEVVGPYEYEKLAHLESSTIFQGMENTSAIFYPEKALAEGRNIERIVAHETAHQWFGDSVTIRDWPDVWLSEGFADYFEALFYEHADGASAFAAKMREGRDRYLKSPVVQRPVVDATTSDLLALLNRNSYDKGAWVLHMLRKTLGDRAFFAGIRTFYRDHRLANATTADLRAALERSSGRPLDWFFRQWLYEPGYPKLHVRWTYDSRLRDVVITIEQTQPASWPTFRLPLTIEIAGAQATRQRVELTARTQTFRVRTSGEPTRITVDPDEEILKEIDPDDSPVAHHDDRQTDSRVAQGNRPWRRHWEANRGTLARRGAALVSGRRAWFGRDAGYGHPEVRRERPS
jgi:aminopeptidase N